MSWLVELPSVIDLAIEEPPIQFPQDIVYCRFPLLDGDGNSPALLQSAIDTTANFVIAQQPTLVACSGGMSRSPVITSAVLAKIESLELNAGFARTPEARSRGFAVLRARMCCA